MSFSPGTSGICATHELVPPASSAQDQFAFTLLQMISVIMNSGAPGEAVPLTMSGLASVTDGGAGSTVIVGGGPELTVSVTVLVVVPMPPVTFVNVSVSE